MKPVFKKVLKVFKYLAILFTIGFWIYAFVDDWIFIEKYDETSDWFEFFKAWSLYFIIYFVAYSFYFWSASTVIILFYYKIIKRIRLTDSK